MTNINNASIDARPLPFNVTLVGMRYIGVRLEFGKYAEGDSLAVSLVDENADELDVPITRLSVNIPRFKLTDEDCILVKDYSENEGLAEQMVDLGLIEPTGRLCASGFVVLHEYRLTDKALAFKS